MKLKPNLEICKKCWIEKHKSIGRGSEKQILYWIRNKTGLTQVRGKHGYLCEKPYVICCKHTWHYKFLHVPDDCKYYLEQAISNEKVGV